MPRSFSLSACTRLPRAFRPRQAYRIHPQPAYFSSKPRPLMPPRTPTDLQTVYTPDGEPIRQQRVRFKKAGIFSLKRLSNVVFYTSAVYLVFWSLSYHYSVKIEFVTDDEEDLDDQPEQVAEGEGGEEGAAGSEEGELFAAEDSLFIPLWVPKQLPRELYKSTDPEWVEMWKLSRDPAKLKEIKQQLAKTVYAASVKHFKHELGKNTRRSGYMLDAVFPPSPPPEYARFGLEWGDDYIALSRQKIDQESHLRLKRAILPDTVAHSFLATIMVHLNMQYKRMKQAMGLEGKDPNSIEERFLLALKMKEKQTRMLEQRKRVGKSQTEPEGNASAVVGPRTTGSDSQTSPANAADDKSDSPMPRIQIPAPRIPGQTQADVPLVLHAFRSTLAKTWDSPELEAPRGCIVVYGMMQILGDRSIIMFDVLSYYDLKTSRYIELRLSPRMIKPRQLQT